MKTSTRALPLVRVPPPLIFAVVFVASVGLQQLIPIGSGSEQFVRTAKAVGAALLACGLIIAIISVVMFARARTTLNPSRTASRLITNGPYQFSRNPMYLSLVIVYLGATGLSVEWWALVLLAVPIYILNSIVIPQEESKMRRAFGEDYSQYCAQVRRWI